MSISITASDVKRKAMIASGNTTYDASISSLITEMQAALEYSIEPDYLSDTTNAGLQATLKLGMLEIITADFLEQLVREEGRTEAFAVSGITIGQATARGVELVAQGAKRLEPYLKSTVPLQSDAVAMSSTIDTTAAFADQP